MDCRSQHGGELLLALVEVQLDFGIPRDVTILGDVIYTFLLYLSFVMLQDPIVLSLIT